MSKAGIQRFLYQFDKNPDLQDAFERFTDKSLDAFELDANERNALATRDVATLYRWGLHPVLIRNFSGTLKMNLPQAYKDGGIGTED